MDKKEWIVAIIVIVGAAFGTFISSSISESEILKPKAQFDIDFVPYFHNVTHGENFTLENFGNAQAKNAILYIEASNPIKITKKMCPEGIEVTGQQQKVHKIQFSKISTGISCSIELQDSPKGNIFSLVVSADDAEGYVHDFDKDDEQTGIFTPLIRSPLEGLTILVVIAYSSAGIAILYLISKLGDDKRKTEKRKKIETELEREIQNVNNEINLFHRDARQKNYQNISPQSLETYKTLLDKSAKFNNKLNSIRIVSSKPTLETSIGQFFNNWITLENQLKAQNAIISQKFENIPIKQMIEQISKLEIASSETIQSLEGLSKFRNNLVHGFKKPEKGELEEKNKELEEVLTKIKDIKISTRNYVRIPIGSSTPGCEEHDECFMPHKLTIKENQIVTWINADNAAHTITNGSPENASSVGTLFDSSLIMSGSQFSHKFKEKGIYEYFCLVHPWQLGIIIVE